jgi:hypothetical protein
MVSFVCGGFYATRLGIIGCGSGYSSVTSNSLFGARSKYNCIITLYYRTPRIKTYH